jgi:hypothetical protein
MFGPLPGLIVSESSTRIVVISPPDWPGTVAVTVTTTGGTSATSAADEFTYLPLWDFLGGIDLGDGFDWPGGDHHHG